MWYTLVANCTGTIYNLIYGTCFTKKSRASHKENWKILFINQIFIHFVKFLITMVTPMSVPKKVMLSCNMPWRCPWGMVMFVESHWSSYELGLFVKVFFKFVVLSVYHFSHKPLHIGGLRVKGFQFLSLFFIFYHFFLCVVKIAWMTNHIKWLGNWVFFVDTTYIPNVEGENDSSYFIRPT